MKDQLQQLIETMRSHVLKNLELIKANEGNIREILTWPLSAERTKELNEGYQYSRTLLSENNDFINLQVSMMNFLNKYKNIIEEDNTVKVTVNTQQNEHLSREEYMKLTIDKDIAFDTSHPYYHDQDFFNEIFTFFEQSENYEMCAQLLRLKK